MALILASTERGCAQEAVRLLRQGELVCYPTDTVYGIGAAARDDAAVRRLYAVKGRPLTKALPLLIAGPTDAALLAEVPPAARRLMDRFWPGALTIVVRKAQGFHSLALAGQDTVALRVPDEPLVREIIRTLGQPITGTSANRSGARAPVSAAEAALQLGDMVSLVIDGGPSPLARESTVVDMTLDGPRIVREGAVGREAIEQALGRSVGT